MRVRAAKKRLVMWKLDERIMKEESKNRVRAAQVQDLGDDEDVCGQDASANGVTVIWHVQIFGLAIQLISQSRNVTRGRIFFPNSQGI